MKVNWALIAGLVVVLLWASAFPAIRVAAPVMGVIGLASAQLLVAVLALLALAVIAKAPGSLGPVSSAQSSCAASST
jgi:L-fucose mutarotase/ribose pyranase (RbsD/FucU family)